MKNLHVNVIKYIDTEAKTTIAQCIDFDNKKVYLLNSTLSLYELDLSTKHAEGQRVKCIGNIVSFDRQLQLDDGKEKKLELRHIDIIAMEFVVEIGSILMAFKEGAIIQFGVHPHSPPSRCLYKHIKAITSLKLSPDQDLIGLADVDHEILTLSIDATILNESNSLSQNESVHQPVGVGWGSKETQFFGLDGRPSKEKAEKDLVSLSKLQLELQNLIETNVDFVKSRQNPQRGTVIDWRGDGQYLATLTYVKDSDKHYLKIWNRNLELQFMSEKLINIESGILSWIPNGRYVCCCQRRDTNINDILMFEKNGMVHQRITLPTLKNFYFHSISWSPDSAILAIIVHEFESNDDKKSLKCKPILLLYTMQNFRYYLKFSTYIVNSGFNITDRYFLRWNLTHQNRFHLLSTAGYYLEYDCYFQPTISADRSTVVVIDGNKLLITPLVCCKVPPPMSALELEFKSLIYKVAINDRDASVIFVLTIDNEIYYTSKDAEQESNHEYFHVKLLNTNAKHLADVYKHKFSFKLVADQNPTDIYQHISATQLEKLFICRCNASTMNQLLYSDPYLGADGIFEIDLSILGKDKDHHIVAIYPSNDCRKIWLIFDDGSFYHFSKSTGTEDSHYTSFTIFDHGSIPDHLNFMQIDWDWSTEDYSLITLTTDMTLRYDDHIVLSNTCTGFRKTKDYLVFSSNDNQINFLLLSEMFSRRFETYSQPIETGGHLIAVDDTNCSVILQMPRGNLEIIQPRILVFATLTQLLDAESYVEAINLARRNRVNLNVIADYLLQLSQASSQEAHLQVFATKIAAQDPQLLNLFITELEDENSCIGRYSNILKHLPFRSTDLRLSYTEPDPREKVNYICSRINLPDESIYLKPKLLCLLKRRPSQAKEALELVFRLNNEEQKEAIKFIVYFRDFDQLWNDALSTYNLDIALIVANASHKDPKEYLALLDELNGYENESLRKHKVDMRTKSYIRAFDHLLEYMFQHSSDSETYISSEKQLIDLLLDKKHFKEAVQSLIDFNHDRKTKLLTTVWSKYASYLLEKRHYPEAAVAFTKAYNLDPKEEHFSSAIKCRFLAGDHERATVLIGRSSVREDLKNELLRKIAAQLVDVNSVNCALFVLEPQRALATSDFLDIMIEKKLYQSALYLAQSGGEQDHLSRKVCADALLTLNRFLGQLEQETNEACEHSDRLKTLVSTHRSERYLDAVVGDRNFIPDSLSTVGSLSTTGSDPISSKQSTKSGAYTIKTRNTSKSNKSQSSNKKRINLKPGSRNEDLALIKEIQKFIESQKSNQQTLNAIVQILYEYHPLADVRKLGSRCKTILKRGAITANLLIDYFWPQGDLPTDYSLYARYHNILSEGNYDNANFEVLIRPEAADQSFTIFEL